MKRSACIELARGAVQAFKEYTQDPLEVRRLYLAEGLLYIYPLTRRQLRAKWEELAQKWRRSKSVKELEALAEEVEQLIWRVDE
jgi:hypothetical protein